MPRTPIFYYTGSKLLVVNFYNIMNTNDTIYNSIFEKNINNKCIKDLKELFLYALKQKTELYNNEGEILKRIISDNEEENSYYTSVYNDGQYSGFTSPQANDFYKDLENLNIKSDFNNSSFLKCLFQITMLGIANSTNKQYTLDNACVIIHKSHNGFKYTGKYWKNNSNNNIMTTIEIINQLKDRINNNR